MNSNLSFEKKFETTNFLKPIGIFFLTELIVVFIFLAFNGGYEEIIDNIAPVFFIILVFALLLSKCTGVKENISQLKNKNMLKELTILMILIFFAETFITVVFSYFVQGGYLPQEFIEGNVVFSNYIIFDLISAIILAPIAEELFFRGFLLNRLNYKLSNRKYSLLISIIITSLLFALAHGFEVCIYIVPAAFVFAMVYLKYDNIFASMTLHAMSNTLAAGLGLLTLYNGFNIDAFTTGVGWDIFFLIIGAISIYFLTKFVVNSYQEINKKIV